MARLGRGAVAYLGPQEDALAVVDDFFERIRHPALTDIQIDFGALGAHEVYPAHMPDLFVGRPVILTGRFDGDETASIRITGRAGGERCSLSAHPAAQPGSIHHGALTSMWARRAIAELSDRAVAEADARLPRQITQLALDHSLMSAYTSFVAVDAASWTGSAPAAHVNVPVPVPDGVRYDTTVSDGSRKQ